MVVHEKFPGFETAVYEVMAEAPVNDGACQVISTEFGDAETVALRGAVGNDTRDHNSYPVEPLSAAKNSRPFATWKYPFRRVNVSKLVFLTPSLAPLRMSYNNDVPAAVPFVIHGSAPYVEL